MPDVAFDLRYLRYAFLVAHHGSFRAAAEELNLSQSTVSRRIVILEKRLGLILFERNHNGARLTPAGDHFIRGAAVGAAQLNQSILDAQSIHQGSMGEIRIGLMTSLTNGFLSELLGQFHRRYPKVQLRVEETSSHCAALGLRSGRMDIAFLPWDPKIEGCTAIPLWVEEPLLAVSRDHRLSEAPVVAWDDIREETFLQPVGLASLEVHQYFFRHLVRDRIAPKMSPQRVGRENLLNMVGGNLGVLFIPSSAFGLVHPHVTIVAVSGGPPPILFNGVWVTRNRNPALKKFLDMATSQSRVMP